MNTTNSNKLNKVSRKVIIATFISAAIASSNVSAYESIEQEHLTAAEKYQEHTNNENIGFGTGAVIGGVAGGPIGAIVGGLGGVFIAKFINVSDEKDELSLALTQEKKTQQLRQDKKRKDYEHELARMESSYQDQLSLIESQHEKAGQLQAENLLMSLQFSTGSSEIAAHYQEQVSALAQILNNSPSMKVDLSGYTDLTGEESLNQTLSQARVASVKKLLMAQGVEEEQISTFAFGEDSPVVANHEQEVSFYDRRVVLKLHSSSLVENDQMANNN
jgi:sortase system peptidoglycan-associated protein